MGVEWGGGRGRGGRWVNARIRVDSIFATMMNRWKWNLSDESVRWNAVLTSWRTFLMFDMGKAGDDDVSA